MLGNLIDNAVKYSSAGGAIRVASERQSDWCRVQVADTGPGIAERDLPHIVEMALSRGYTFLRAPFLEE